MIVKIQSSLFPVEKPTVLIYDKSRAIMVQEPLSAKMQALLGDAPKGYFHANIDSKGRLHIGKSAPMQAW